MVSAISPGRNILSYKTKYVRGYITGSFGYHDTEFGIFLYTRAILMASTYDPSNPIVEKVNDYLQEQARLLKHSKNTDS